jgi:hypothetical protein
MTHQPSFSRAEFAIKKKTTRREKFLMRMEALIPWTKLLTVIEPGARIGAPRDALLEEKLECNLHARRPRRSDGWAPAGTSDSTRARRPAFDDVSRTPVARFVSWL